MKLHHFIPFAAFSLLAMLGAGGVAGEHDGRGGPGERETLEISMDWAPGRAAHRRSRTLRFRFESLGSVAAPLDVRDGRFALVPLPGAPGDRIGCALDLEPGHERIWIDTDADASLADESALAWRRDGLRWSVAATVRVAGDAGAVPVDLRLERGAFGPEDVFEVNVDAHRFGALQRGGRLIAVALEDGDGNLRFETDGRDALLIDLDADGAFDDRPGSPERVGLGGELRLGAGTFTVGVSSNGDRVTLREQRTARLPRAGAAVAPPDAGLDALTARFVEQRARSVQERALTLRSIGATGHQEAAEFLRHVARDHVEHAIRVAATEALGNPAFRDAAGEPLAALARNLGPSLASAGVRALHAMGFEDRERVYVELLERSDPEVIREAVRHLMALDTAAARGAVVRAVSEHRARQARVAAYMGARAAPDGAPAQAALAAARDSYAPLRLMALEDLSDRGDSRVRRLLLKCAEEASPSIARALLPLLARQRDGATTEALLRLGTAVTRSPLALELLARLDDNMTTTRLADALDDEDDAIRILAATALGGRRDSRAASALLTRLATERQAHVRTALLAALGEHGDARAIGVLAKLAESKEHVTPSEMLRQLSTPWVRGVPEVVTLLRRSLRGDSWRTRAAAADAVVAIGETSLIAELRSLLKDEHRVVRRTAARALGEVRHRDSVRPLIDRLAREHDGTVRAAAATALFRLTGANLYDGHDLWERWWADHGDRFRVPAVAPELPPEAVAGTAAPAVPKFYGIELETESVVFVIDRSGSMSGAAMQISKFDRAVKELLGAVNGLEDGDRVNVVFFDNGVASWQDRLQSLSSRTRRALRRYLGRQTPGGATCLYDALERGVLTRGVETVVLLSDGEPTTGRYVSGADIANHIRQQNKKREVVIHCVSIGGHSPLLRQLARENDGNYVRR